MRRPPRLEELWKYHSITQIISNFIFRNYTFWRKLASLQVRDCNYEDMKMETINDLFQDQIKDLYNAEKQLLKALPKLAKKATAPRLKEGFESHLKETEEHVRRLEQIGEMWGFKLTGKKCKAMEGLIEEGKEVLEEDGHPDVIDAALIAAAQRVEHYEIAAYGTAKAFAKKLGCKESESLLSDTLQEEGKADKKLTEVSEKIILKSAPIEEEE